MNQGFNQCLENSKVIVFPKGKELISQQGSLSRSERFGGRQSRF